MSDLDFSQINALVVEDDSSGAAVIGVMLRYLGISAMINTTGEDVIELACAMNPPPDIIFLDINLPKTTGYALLKQIRAEPLLAGARVVAVTALDSRTEVARYRQAGFDGFIGKPLSRARFPQQVRRILSGEAVWSAD